MGTAIVILIVVLVVLLIAGVAVMSLYNGFVKSRNLIQESWRQIDVELNRRYELIPNLVETVRAFASHERNTLEDVTRLRSQAQAISAQEGSLPTEQRSQAEEQLSGAVRNLMVSVEAYPELKSNTNFLELQRQLAETEDRIAAGRRFYNANVRVYNTKVDSVPSNIIANMFNFEKATYFEVNDQAVRQAPDVNFGEIAYRGDQPQQQNRPSGQGQVGSQVSGDQLPDPQQYQQPQNQQQSQPQYEQPQGQQSQNQQPQSQQDNSGGYQPPQTR